MVTLRWDEKIRRLCDIVSKSINPMQSMLWQSFCCYLGNFSGGGEGCCQLKHWIPKRYPYTMCITRLNQFFFIFTCTFCERGGGALAPFWDESAKRRLQGCLFCSPVISGGGGVSATPEKLLTFDQQLPWGWFLPQFPLGKDAACLCWPTSDRRCRHNLKNVMEISSRGLQGPRNFWECHWSEHQRLQMWMSLLQVPHLFETICCLFCLPQSVSVYHTRCVHGHVHCQLGHDGRTGGPGIKHHLSPKILFLQVKVH